MRLHRPLSFAVRTCIVLGLLACVYLAMKQGIAAWYFRRNAPDKIQTAMKLDPANPQYPDALANLMHRYSDNANADEIVHLTKRATLLSPFDAHYWADLGSAYDWAGHPQEARQAFEHARELFPKSPEINWRLANFYVRNGLTDEALDSLHEVLLENPAAQRQVFALAASASPDNAAVLAHVLPPDSAVFFDYLDYQLQSKNLDGAEQTWARILQLNLPFQPKDAFPYLDALIQKRDIDRLAESWSVLARRFPAKMGPRISPSNLITNGDFRSDILNGGLAWRVLPVKGAVVSRRVQDSPDGAPSLQIEFDGTKNLDYEHVLQFVLVNPATQYEFSADVRTQGITTDSGPRFQVLDAYDARKLLVSSDSLVGTSAWSAQKLEFKTGPETRLLIVRIVRPMSQKFDNKIAGTMQITRVSLEPRK